MEGLGLSLFVERVKFVIFCVAATLLWSAPSIMPQSYSMDTPQSSVFTVPSIARPVALWPNANAPTACTPSLGKRDMASQKLGVTVESRKLIDFVLPELREGMES